jgi:hypothetical protein
MDTACEGSGCGNSANVGLPFCISQKNRSPFIRPRLPSRGSQRTRRSLVRTDGRFSLTRRSGESDHIGGRRPEESQIRWVVGAFRRARPALRISPRKRTTSRNYIYVSEIGVAMSFGTRDGRRSSLLSDHARSPAAGRLSNVYSGMFWALLHIQLR